MPTIAAVGLPEATATLFRRSISAECAAPMFDDGPSFLKFSDQTHVDCIVCADLGAGPSARALHAQWSERDPWATTLILVDEACAYDVSRILPKGAVRVLQQPFEPIEVGRKIEELQRQGAARRTAFLRARRAAELMRRLTPREREVVDALYQGTAHKRIASKLRIALRTVEYRRKCALRKLEVATLAEMVRIVVESEHAEERYGLS